MSYIYYTEPTSYSYDAGYIQQQQLQRERQFQLQFQRERKAQLQRERQKQLEQQHLLAAMYMAEQQEREYEYERQRQLKARLYKQRQQQLIAQQQERHQYIMAERAKQQDLYDQRYQQYLSDQKQRRLNKITQAQASSLKNETARDIIKNECNQRNSCSSLDENMLISILKSFGAITAKSDEDEESNSKETNEKTEEETSEQTEEIEQIQQKKPIARIDSNSPISEEISEAPKIDPNSTIPDEISETPASYSRPPSVVVAPKGVEIKTSIPKDLSSEEIANKLSAVEKQVTRHGDTLNRLQRYVNGSAQSSDSDANISSRVVSSRLKVLQKAQLELESLYSDLDDIVVPRSDTENKKTKKDLTKRAVTIADKMDILSAELQSRKSEVSERELSVSESSESENDEKVNFTPESDTEFVKIESPGYVSNDNDSDSSTSSLKSTGSLRRVTIETVPDADSDFDY